MKYTLLILFIIPSYLFSQTNIKKVFLKKDSSLLEKSITVISTDSTGLNWIGTLEGLICYNGKRWVNLNTENSKLPSNKILCIEIHGNTKYIGTTEGFLIIKNNDWEVFTTTNSNLPSNKIRKIKTNKGVVWIATSAGLVKYKNNKNDFEVCLSKIKNTIFDDDFISLNIDDNETVWLGTNNGLYSFKESIWRVFTTKNSQLPNNKIWNIVVDGNDNKWIATKNGLTVITNEGWQLFDKKNSPLRSNRINSIICDDYDRVWVSTEKGVISYDGDKWERKKTKIWKKEVITNLFIDAFDNKWICTLTDIVLFNAEGIEFKNNITTENSFIVSR